MMNYKSRRGLIIILSLCAGTLMNMAFTDELEKRKLYITKLTYEYNNRAFAYISMEKAARAHQGSASGEFYQAYYELEVKNRAIYTHMLSELAFEHKVGWFTHLRGKALGFYLSMTGGSPKMLIDIINPYISELQKLRELSDPEHSEFFDYVVDQETAQLHASKLAQLEGWQKGAEALRNFTRNTNIVLGERV